ncbi:MAG: glycosyltransferase family 2 protein, partial [Prevotellaceae bacterium]|nr:glycosyltransferase family 2 protein [Prevotellaceae bacterium]
MNCRISLIVPIYNVEAYLVECLDSVANQTVTDGVECILVDDKGTDSSMTIAEKWIDAYRNDESKEKKVEFVVVHHECNKGLSEARNTGISVAKGDYVYFLDSDDSIAPDCMEEMIRLVDKYPDVDMVIGNNDINDILRVPFGEFTNDRKIILRNLLYYNGRAVAAQRHM